MIGHVFRRHHLVAIAASQEARVEARVDGIERLMKCCVPILWHDQMLDGGHFGSEPLECHEDRSHVHAAAARIRHTHGARIHDPAFR